MATKSSRGAVGASASPKVATRHASACASRSGRVHVVRSSPHMGHAHPSRGRPPPAVARLVCASTTRPGEVASAELLDGSSHSIGGDIPVGGAMVARRIAHARAPARPDVAPRPVPDLKRGSRRDVSMPGGTCGPSDTNFSRLGAPARPARIRRRPVRPARRASAPFRRSTRDMRIKFRHPRSKTWCARGSSPASSFSRVSDSRNARLGPRRTSSARPTLTHPSPTNRAASGGDASPPRRSRIVKPRPISFWPNYLRTSPTPPTASSATTTSSFGIPDTGSDATA